MRCTYYIQSKKRYCRFISQCPQICVFHNNFLKKNKKLGLYKIGQLIKKNKYHFFTYMYYKKILRNFFFVNIVFHINFQNVVFVWNQFLVMNIL